MPYDLIPLVYECEFAGVCVCVQNRSLQAEARGMRALRDELDCARERAARAEQLQNELQSCKNRLRSLELTRTQLKVNTHACTHHKHASHNTNFESLLKKPPL